MKKSILLRFCIVIPVVLLFCSLTLSLVACIGQSSPSDDNDTPLCSHVWQAATCTKAKTCTLCGATEGAPLAHNWQNATCSAPETCTVCGKTKGTPLEHVFATYIITDPTCTQPGSKTSECTLCKTTVTIDTYLPLGHKLIHGKCTRCDTDQNNIYVAIKKDDSYGISDYIAQAWTYYSAALKVVSSDRRSFDSYYTYMLRELNNVWNYSLFAQNRWTTDAYAFPATAYEEMRAVITALQESPEYKTYSDYKGKDYDSVNSMVARNKIARSTYEYMEQISDKSEELLNYYIEIMKKSEYLESDAATPEDIVCYATGNAEDSGFRISCNSDLRIVLDSFNKTLNERVYIAEITDGEHVYTQTVEATTAGTHSVTFSDCVLNEGAKVTLSLYNGQKTPVAQFNLLAVAMD